MRQSKCKHVCFYSSRRLRYTCDHKMSQYLVRYAIEANIIIDTIKQQLSVGKVLDAVKTITTIRVKMPENEEIYTKTLFLTDKHRAIRSLFDFADEPK